MRSESKINDIIYKMIRFMYISLNLIHEFLYQSDIETNSIFLSSTHYKHLSIEID